MTLLIAAILMMPICDCAETLIMIDGKTLEQAWQAVAWPDEFVDIEGDTRPKPRFRTRVKMPWDDEHFHVFADIQEPHIWDTLLLRDSVIFHDNDSRERNSQQSERSRHRLVC